MQTATVTNAGSTTATSTPQAPLNIPAVLTSQPARDAVATAQAKIAKATAPKPTTLPGNVTPGGAGMPNEVTGNTPTFPIGSTRNVGKGAEVLTSNGWVKQPGTTAPTATQQAANSNPPANGTAPTPPAANNGGNGENSGSNGASGGTSGTAPANIPGTDIPSTGDPTTDAIIAKYSGGMADLTTWANEVKTQMDGLRTTIDNENAQLLDLIGSTFDSTISAQEAANAAQLQGIQNLGIRSGLSRYSPGLYTSSIKGVLDAGLAKLSDIQTKKAAAIAKAQAANDKQDWTSLYQETQTLDKMKTDEQNQMLDLLKQVQTAKKDTAQAAKDAATAQAAQQKSDTQEATAHAYAILSALDAEAGVKGESTLEQDAAMVKEYAAAWGLDPQKLLAAVEQLKMTKDSYGSGIIGQYQFYSDTMQKSGMTPLSFTEWQVQTAAEKAAATAQAKKNASGSAQGNQLTKSQYAKLSDAGIDQSMADLITSSILSGEDLDQIRADMRSKNVDPALLDTYDRTIGIDKLLKTKKPKASSATGYQ